MHPSALEILSGLGVQNPRPWEILWASGSVFSNTSLLSAVYGYITSPTGPFVVRDDKTIAMVHTTGLQEGVLLILVEMSLKTNKRRSPMAAKTHV